MKIRIWFLKCLSLFIYSLDTKHRKIAQANLDLAYGDSMNPTEKKTLIKKVYENLLFNIADFIDNQGISKDRLLKKVTFVDESFFYDAQKSKKPIILLTAHYGNWELLALAFAAKYGPTTGVGRPLDSAPVNAILKLNREQFDIEMVDKKGAMRSMIHALKHNRILGLLVDQNTSDSEGILIDFFNHQARHTSSIAALAKKFDALALPVFIHTDDHIHHTITFHPSFAFENTGNESNDIAVHVQKQASITETVIRSKPDEWFWLHKRWKNQYPHIYQ